MTRKEILNIIRYQWIQLNKYQNWKSIKETYNIIIILKITHTNYSV